MSGVMSVGPVSVKERRMGFVWRATVRPVDLWFGAFALTLIPISLLWDFSWESSIGVDRFWSPPHLATHAGVWLSGLLGARLLFVFTRCRGQGAAGGVTSSGVLA